MTYPMPAAPHQSRPLREAHAHLFQHGRAMGMLQLAGCRGVDDCLQLIAGAADAARQADAPGSGWILGTGLRIESWSEPRYPTLAELDGVAGHRPLCLWSFDHHALVVNTAALQATAISSDTPDPSHGRILRDGRGRPTGLMLEGAAKLVWERIPAPTARERRELVRAAAHDLAAHGFVEVHDLLSQPWLGPTLAELHDAGELPIGVCLYPLLPDLASIAATAGAWQRPTVRLAGAKIFADGTLNSRTAWMLSPYADPIADLPRGQSMVDPGQLAEALHITAALNLSLAVHAIGDAAVRAVLDSYQRHRAATFRSLPRLRIEHAEIIDEADIPRFAELAVTCSVQPCHLLADIEVLRRSLPHRLHRVLPLRELIDSGCTPGELLHFGSDTPIVRPDPHDSIQAAVHRRREGMPAGEAIAPEQAITEEEAWGAFARRL
jgi:predicted amidohydrolase YtcJ